MKQSNRQPGTGRRIIPTRRHIVRRIIPIIVSTLLFLGLLVNKLAYERRHFLYQGGVGESPLSFSAIAESEAWPAFWLPRTKQRLPSEDQRLSTLTVEPQIHVEVGQFTRKKNRHEDNAMVGSLTPAAGTDMSTPTQLIDLNQNASIQNASWDMGIDYHPPETPGAFLVGHTPPRSEPSRQHLLLWFGSRCRPTVFSLLRRERIQDLLASNFDTSTIFAVRTKNLWGDWISTNEHLGQKNVSTSNIRERDHGHLRLPASKKISNAGRRNLCLALKAEYDAYLDFLRKAENLDDTERAKSLKIGNRNCPWLNLSM
jgi:hypothetical protein